MEKERVVFRVQKELSKYLHSGAHYLLAVSGGADSMALADAAASLLPEGVAVSVCHVEHGLRGEEALRDLELVRSFCVERGLSFYAEHVDVRMYAASAGVSTEAAARALRYASLRRVLETAGADAIVTAHHRDDQAETVLLRLLRGAGPEGLAAMSGRNGDVLRPLLGISRAELEEYCVVREIACCHDSTNDDTCYTRNRVRLELLPYLRRKFNPQISSALVRTAELLREDEDFLDDLAEALFKECLLAHGAGSAELDARRLLSSPRALGKRVLRKAYFLLGGQELAYERTQALLELCGRRTGGKLIQLPGGICARYAKNRLCFEKG